MLVWTVDVVRLEWIKLRRWLKRRWFRLFCAFLLLFALNLTVLRPRTGQPPRRPPRLPPLPISAPLLSSLPHLSTALQNGTYSACVWSLLREDGDLSDLDHVHLCRDRFHHSIHSHSHPRQLLRDYLLHFGSALLLGLPSALTLLSLPGSSCATLVLARKPRGLERNGGFCQRFQALLVSDWEEAESQAGLTAALSAAGSLGSLLRRMGRRLLPRLVLQATEAELQAVLRLLSACEVPICQVELRLRRASSNCPGCLALLHDFERDSELSLFAVNTRHTGSLSLYWLHTHHDACLRSIS